MSWLFGFTESAPCTALIAGNSCERCQVEPGSAAESCDLLSDLLSFSGSGRISSPFLQYTKLFAILQEQNLKSQRRVALQKTRGQCCKILKIFAKFLKIQLAHSVDLEKCCKMSIWLQKSVLIQPRTSLGKSDVSWLTGSQSSANVCISAWGIQRPCAPCE